MNAARASSWTRYRGRNDRRAGVRERHPTNRGGSDASQGWTDLVVTPGRGVRVIDGLLTGFHQPRASHLAMLEAIAGRSHVEIAYQAALAGRYLWHEFGDLHLLLPGTRYMKINCAHHQALVCD